MAFLSGIAWLLIQFLEASSRFLYKYGFSFWDSMIVAAALDNHCSILYSEDLHHEQIIEGKLQIVNPFIIQRWLSYFLFDWLVYLCQ